VTISRNRREHQCCVRVAEWFKAPVLKFAFPRFVQSRHIWRSVSTNPGLSIPLRPMTSCPTIKVMTRAAKLAFIPRTTNARIMVSPPLPDIQSYNRQREACARRDDRKRLIVWQVSLSNNSPRNLANAVSCRKAEHERIGANPFDDDCLFASVADHQLHGAFIEFKIQMRERVPCLPQ
jgi:hypothetical protein